MTDGFMAYNMSKEQWETIFRGKVNINDFIKGRKSHKIKTHKNMDNETLTAPEEEVELPTETGVEETTEVE